MMFKFRKVNDTILLKKLQHITKTVRSIADDLKAQRGERDVDDTVLTKIAQETETVERAMAEILALITRIKRDTGAMQARKLEQREVELTTIRRVEDATDQIADTGTITANTMEYLLSSPPAIAEILGKASPQVLSLSLRLLADLGYDNTIELLKRNLGQEE